MPKAITIPDQDHGAEQRANALLATLLREGRADWPVELAPDVVVERAIYHGVAALVLARRPDWSPAVMDTLRREALARTFWELRHRHVMVGVLEDLAKAGVAAVLMKGTALAYGLYAEPAARARGDSDLLVAPGDVARVRAILSARGFRPFYTDDAPPDDARLQEPWTLITPDGQGHDIDLHWQALNSAMLEPVLPVAEALAEAVALPSLGPNARGLSHPHALLHACAHRASHILSPYFVGGRAHYGGDRLIWLVDIDLLARAMTPEEWENITTRAIARGIAPVCARALRDAASLLNTQVPPDVMARLQAAPGGAATDYLLESRQGGRALQDLMAQRGFFARARFIRQRLFPRPELLRAKYPGAGGQPLIWLYLRRIADFLRRRGI